MEKNSNVISFASLLNKNTQKAKLPYFRRMRRIWLKQGVENWVTLTPTKSMRKRRLKAQKLCKEKEAQARKARSVKRDLVSNKYYTANRYVYSDQPS